MYNFYLQIVYAEFYISCVEKIKLVFFVSFASKWILFCKPTIMIKCVELKIRLNLSTND